MKIQTERANALIDELIKRMGLKNDSHLVRVMGERQSVISNIRHGRINMGSKFILRAHLVSNIAVKELLEIVGVKLLNTQHEAA